MITLQRPDPKISMFLGESKGINRGDIVRPSQFALTMNLGRRCVILNTLTGQCIESKYFKWFEFPEERAFDENDAEMAALVKRDFLVKAELNEAERYARLIKVIRQVEKPKSGYTGYTILPTTACNARCVYCYEEGIPYETMSDETLEKVIDYIKSTRREDATVNLHWFGGEPLMGEKIIDRICKAMRDAEIEYSSNMISNGSLMTKKLARKAKEDWRLKNIQITLDGREDVYCERKRYVSFDGSPYRAVLDGIHAMLDQKIRINIRLNADENNVEELIQLTDDLEEEFREESLVSIYSHSIFAQDEEDAERDSTLLYDCIKRLEDRLYEFNNNRREKHKGEEPVLQEAIDDANIEWQTDKDRCPEDDEEAKAVDRKYYDRKYNVKRYYCMFDNPAAGPVILPDGSMRLCEHVGDFLPVGMAYDRAAVDKRAFVVRGREKVEKCAACAFLPACTDFTCCPIRERDCRQMRAVTEKRALRNLADEKKLPPITIFHSGKVIRVIEPTAEFAEKCTPILADDYLKVDEYMEMEDAERLFC